MNSTDRPPGHPDPDAIRAAAFEKPSNSMFNFPDSRFDCLRCGAENLTAFEAYDQHMGRCKPKGKVPPGAIARTYRKRNERGAT